MLHNEARRLLVKAYEKTNDAKAVATAYSVAPSTVYRLVRQAKKQGSVDLKTSQRGRKHKLSQADIDRISTTIQEQPDITIEEIMETLGLTVSYYTVRRAIVNLGYTRKKKMIHASEQERPRCTGEKAAVAYCRIRASH